MSEGLELIINGETIKINPFVKDILRDVIMAVVTHLKGVELREISKIELS